MVSYKVLTVNDDGEVIDSMDINDDSYYTSNGVLTVTKITIDRNGHLSD